MGAYRFSIYIAWQLGFYVSYEPHYKSFTLIVLCFEFIMSLNKYAKGFHFENELKLK